MILILAANAFDQKHLDALLVQYDASRDSAERERVAAEIDALLSPAVQAILRRNLGGLDIEDFSGMASEAIRLALAEAGNTRLRKNEIHNPERLIERMKVPGDEAGQRLRSLLPDDLRDLLTSAKYIRTDVELRGLLDYLNDDLLHRPDLAKNLGLTGPENLRSTNDLTAYNAAVLHELFGDAVQMPATPERSLMGYIVKFVVPEFKARLLKETGKAADPTVSRAKRSLGPIIDELRGRLGRLPDENEVNEAYRGMLSQRYRPAVQWFQEQVASQQPDRAFVIRRPPALNDAKEILKEKGFDPALWESGGQYYVPREYFKPVGVETIRRVLEEYTRGNVRLPDMPSAGSVPAGSSTGESPAWAQNLGASGGAELYRRVLEHLYSQPQFGAERAVGEFLAANGDPRGADFEQYLASLDPAVAEDIRQIGFENLAHEVDERVLEVLRDPQMRTVLVGHQGARSGGFHKQFDAIRREIFIRKAYRIEGFLRFGRIPQTLSDRRTRVIRSRISIASSRVRSSS